MTNLSLAQRFQEARAPKIEVDGREIYGLYEIDVSSGETVLPLDFYKIKNDNSRCEYKGVELWCLD